MWATGDMLYSYCIKIAALMGDIINSSKSPIAIVSARMNLCSYETKCSIINYNATAIYVYSKSFFQSEVQYLKEPSSGSKYVDVFFVHCSAPDNVVFNQFTQQKKNWL